MLVIQVVTQAPYTNTQMVETAASIEHRGVLNAQHVHTGHVRMLGCQRNSALRAQGTAVCYHSPTFPAVCVLVPGL
jgi:hypothetical protein